MSVTDRNKGPKQTGAWDTPVWQFYCWDVKCCGGINNKGDRKAQKPVKRTDCNRIILKTLRYVSFTCTRSLLLTLDFCRFWWKLKHDKHLLQLNVSAKNSRVGCSATQFSWNNPLIGSVIPTALMDRVQSWTDPTHIQFTVQVGAFNFPGVTLMIIGAF